MIENTFITYSFVLKNIIQINEIATINKILMEPKLLLYVFVQFTKNMTYSTFQIKDESAGTK